jgi:hypothetical protein
VAQNPAKAGRKNRYSPATSSGGLLGLHPQNPCSCPKVSSTPPKEFVLLMLTLTFTKDKGQEALGIPHKEEKQVKALCKISSV